MRPRLLNHPNPHDMLCHLQEWWIPHDITRNGMSLPVTQNLWKGFLGPQVWASKESLGLALNTTPVTGWIFRMLRYVERLVKPYPTDISTDLLSSSSRLSSYSFSIVQFSAPFFSLKHLYFNFTAVARFRGIPIKACGLFSSGSPKPTEMNGSKWSYWMVSVSTWPWLSPKFSTYQWHPRTKKIWFYL